VAAIGPRAECGSGVYSSGGKAGRCSGRFAPSAIGQTAATARPTLQRGATAGLKLTGLTADNRSKAIALEDGLVMRPVSLLALTALLALAGLPSRLACADDAMTEAAPADNASGFGNVDLVDGALAGKLGVLRVGSDRTGTNLLSISATLKNATGHALTIEAQTLYKDADGNWIDGGRAGWLTLEIKPHGELRYRSASLSDDARDFLVRIRLSPSVAAE
jgi:hypothetical protein